MAAPTTPKHDCNWRRLVMVGVWLVQSSGLTGRGGRETLATARRTCGLPSAQN